MAFEEFKAKKVQLKTPFVSILRSGNIGVNSACYKKYFKDYTYIVFFYDRERRIIGIKPVEKELPNSYSIRRNRAGGGSGNVAASAFLKSFVGIDYNKQGSKGYEVSWNDDEGLLEVYLDRPIGE